MTIDQRLSMIQIELICLFRVRFVDEAPVTAPAEVTSSSRAGELESLKQELLAEMRHELQKVKNEIVQGLIRTITLV